MSKPDERVEPLEVPAESLKEASRRLQKDWAVELSDADTKALLRTDKEIPGRGKIYLLRGIRYNVDGGWTVLQRDQNTLVLFGSMGSMAVKSRNSAVVARLQGRPQHVYTLASIDE